MLEKQKENLKKLKENSSSKLEELIIKVLYIVFFIAYNIFEILLVYIIGKYNGRVLEILMIMGFFFLNKAIYGKPLHFSDNFKCLGVSLIAFYVGIRITFDTNISIFTNVIVGLLIGALTSYIATYLYKENKELKKRNLVKELVDLKLNDELIEQICKKNGLDEEIGFIVNFRLTHNEDLTCYEFSIDRSTLNRKLNKFLKVAK